jgi:hypothetical protein
MARTSNRFIVTSLIRPLILSACVIFSLLPGCHKVPLREAWGEFDLVAAHWFENEKTQYFFFSIAGLRPEQATTIWPSVFELSIDNGPFKPLDFSKAVHRHRIVSCGNGRLCGSYSLKAESPASAIQVRFRYHAESSISRVTSANNSIHPASSGADAQSALIYGVFDATNARVQIRAHDNFGSPNSDQITQYGMERMFEVRDVTLGTLAVADQKELEQRTGSGLLFPADSCDSKLKPARNKTSNALIFRGHKAWARETFDANDPSNAACFHARSLDQHGQMLTESAALARRNPVLAGDSTVLRTPLNEARRIPIVISYCQDRSEHATLSSPLFLDYQRFILGLGKTAIDACFSVGGEDQFASDLERVLNRKIADARLAGESSDFIFVIAINHRLTPIIRRFHQIISDKLNDKVTQEKSMVSPRLVGAFVYDSSPLEERGISPGAGIIWCPQLDPSIKGQESAAAGSANCVGYRGGRADLGIFNFVIPMGPFPTLDTYESHVREFGDRGRARNPQLLFQSVRTDVNSLNVLDKTLTFFDGERISVREGEGMRFCLERDEEGVLNNLVFRARIEGESEPQILTLSQTMPLAKSGAAQVNFDLGIQWEQPFWGGVTFEMPVEGKVLSVIPMSLTGQGQQKLGDPKWQRIDWKVGALVQRCTRFCDHPFFDEAGTYQVNSTWRESWGSCPQPRYPEPQP